MAGSPLQPIAVGARMATLELKILKQDAAPEQRMVFAEVYAPNRPDSDGEFMKEETIRKMAHAYAIKLALKQVDQQHDNLTTDGVQVVESFIARKGDPDFIEGAWVVGIWVNDDATWAKIQKGELNGLSIEANVAREPRDVEIDIPPVIQGLTHKSEGHQHDFFVSYDENGKFRGGTTSVVDGHSHAIKCGTVTEEAGGHTHRFAAVDHLIIESPETAAA